MKSRVDMKLLFQRHRQLAAFQRMKKKTVTLREVNALFNVSSTNTARHILDLLVEHGLAEQVSAGKYTRYHIKEDA